MPLSDTPTHDFEEENEKLLCTEGETRHNTCEEAAKRRRALQECKTMCDPETLERLSDEYLALLNELRAMPYAQFMKAIPSMLKEKQYDASFFVYLLAIEARKPKSDNFVEKSENPQALYKEMVDSFIADGRAFRQKVLESQTLNKEQLIKNLNRFGKYFKQVALPPVKLDRLETYSQDELLAIYQFCLLEEQVRATGITYDKAHTSGFFTALLPHDEALTRLGKSRTADCNTTALYYAALIAFSGSALLRRAVQYANFTNHTQIHFKYEKIEFAKNTSYVDAKNLDSSGKDPGNVHPFGHNFYDPKYTLDLYGVTPEQAILPPGETGASLFAELLPEDMQFDKLGIGELTRIYRAFEASLQVNSKSAGDIHNYICVLNELYKRGKIEPRNYLLKMRNWMALHSTLTFDGTLNHLCFYIAAALEIHGNEMGMAYAKPAMEAVRKRLKSDVELWRSYLMAPIKIWMDLQLAGQKNFEETSLRSAYQKRTRELINAITTLLKIEVVTKTIYSSFVDSEWKEMRMQLQLDLGHMEAHAKGIGWAK